MNSLHARTAIQAMQAGKAVLCEKPFAISVEEGETVLQAAKTTGRVFVEAMWTTHLPAYRRLFELLTSGDLGEAIHLQADFGYLPMLRHFVAMIHRRDESRLANDQAISLEVLRVVDRARQAPTKVDDHLPLAKVVTICPFASADIERSCRSAAT